MSAIPPEVAVLQALGFTPVSGGNSPAFTAVKDRIVDDRALEALKGLVAGRPGSAARINLHAGPEAPVHDMIVALSAGGKPFIHKHRTREESYHLIEGRLLLRLFEADGRVVETTELGGPGTGLPLIARIAADRWHSTEPLTDVVLFHEARPGPFDPSDTLRP